MNKLYITHYYYPGTDPWKYLVNDTYKRVMEAKTIREILDPSEADQ
ncbi:MAG: hypothetical protein K6E85_00925 [Lachnospiraceae bacterium]|nr:hypothetical protein [Lachnospiraceae bacterium]